MSDSNYNENLTYCTACGASISKSAESCPQCGHPMRVKTPQVQYVPVQGNKQIGFWGIVFAIIVAVVLIAIFG